MISLRFTDQTFTFMETNLNLRLKVHYDIKAGKGHVRYAVSDKSLKALRMPFEHVKGSPIQYRDACFYARQFAQQQEVA